MVSPISSKWVIMGDSERSLWDFKLSTHTRLFHSGRLSTIDRRTKSRSVAEFFGGIIDYRLSAAEGRGKELVFT